MSDMGSKMQILPIFQGTAAVLLRAHAFDYDYHTKKQTGG